MAEVRTTSSTGGQKGVKAEAFSLMPVEQMRALARHYKRGAQKYSPNQWRQGMEIDKLYDAALRHLTAFWGGENDDICKGHEEDCSYTTFEGEPFTNFVQGVTCYNHTGSPHNICAVWMLFAIEEIRQTHPEHDTRYIPDRLEAETVVIQNLYNNALNAMSSYDGTLNVIDLSGGRGV